MKKMNIYPALCFVGGAALILSLQGCTSSEPTKAWTPELKTVTKTVTETAKPAGDYFEIEHMGRIFVIGEPEMAEKFEKHKHLPYTYTKIGAGPKGETVIVQVDKKNPQLQERLWEEFKEKNLFYTEMEHNGRIFVIGEAEMAEKFEKHKHLPYTYTQIGAGPAGQTVIVQVDKKNPALQQRLWKQFQDTHLYYTEMDHNGRTFVIGEKEMAEKFAAHKHLPYTRTFIGAAKGGGTLILQVDKKNPSLVERLQREYQSRHDVTL